MAGNTAAAQCGIVGVTPQVEWPQRCSMCTFPVMIIILFQTSYKNGTFVDCNISFYFTLINGIA